MTGHEENPTCDFDAENGGSPGAAAASLSGEQHVADRRWRMPDAGAVRLNPVEMANPAYRADPAFGRTASGAYGGRGPRYEGGAKPSATAEDGLLPAVDSPAAGEGPEVKTCGSYSYIENADGTATLVSYEGVAKHVDVPARVAGRDVSHVGAALFSGHDEMEAVVVPAPIRAIGDHAFDGCAALVRVDLPDTLDRIGLLAFAKTGLARIDLPQSLAHIGDKAFFHCKHLVEAELPHNLESVGDGAFAYSGLRSAHVPASVSQLGFNAFERTPAQRDVAQGCIAIDAGNPYYRLDGAGLYCGDALVELIGNVRAYDVAPGTRRIGDGACKRHPTLERVVLPEGLVEIGDDAFRGNRRLRSVHLPESLQVVGARAFVDTSVSSLRIARGVSRIGEDALLVQGEAQMSVKVPLAHVDLDPDNPVYYLEGGLLCERGTSPGGGDTCLLYVGPDTIVRIPEQVTTLGVMAFGGASGIDELYVHGHVHSFCYGWLSVREPIRLLHVEFGDPVDGLAWGDFPSPGLSTRFRYMTDLFSSADGKTVFDFNYYDAWVTCSCKVGEFALGAYERMRRPVGMSEHTRSVYEGIFRRKGKRICRFFADRSQIDALEFMAGQGWIGLCDVDSELEVSLREGRAQATACLLEMRRRLAPAQAGGVDFGL